MQISLILENAPNAKLTTTDVQSNSQQLAKLKVSAVKLATLWAASSLYFGLAILKAPLKTK